MPRAGETEKLRERVRPAWACVNCSRYLFPARSIERGDADQSATPATGARALAGVRAAPLVPLPSTIDGVTVPASHCTVFEPSSWIARAGCCPKETDAELQVETSRVSRSRRAWQLELSTTETRLNQATPTSSTVAKSG